MRFRAENIKPKVVENCSSGTISGTDGQMEITAPL
jgi:hypothetical protein